MISCRIFNIIAAGAAIFLLAVSFNPNEGQSMGKNPSPVIEFLGGSKCPKSPEMEGNLVSALKTNKMTISYIYIDLASLSGDDFRRGYGTPTILLNGHDLFGMPKPLPTSKAPS
jgi:hypothetical protein